MRPDEYRGLHLIPKIPESFTRITSSPTDDSQSYEGDLTGDRDYAQKYYYGLLPSLTTTTTSIPTRRRSRRRDLRGGFRATRESVNRSKFVFD